MAAGAAVVPTVQARVLVGWMERDEAVNFLTQECVPAMNMVDAQALWTTYRARVTALPTDRVPAYTPLTLTPEEQAHARRFMAFLATIPASGVEVVKVDLRQVVAQQLYVVVERSETYGTNNTTEAEWLNQLIPTAIQNPAVQMRFGLGPPHAPNPMSSVAVIDVPHAEFALLPNPATGTFSATQFMRQVTVFFENGRVILKAGYHRSLARLRSAPMATVPTAVVAREVNVTTGLPNHPAAGAGVTAGTLTLGPLGSRAPLLIDFITDDLFIEVSIRRKKYQLHVQSIWLAIDDV